jgi:hypothetical protein
MPRRLYLLRQLPNCAKKKMLRIPPIREEGPTGQAEISLRERNTHPAVG